MPRLAVVDDPSTEHVLEPPGKLDAIGFQLWESVTSQYQFEDPGSVEMLYQACVARSRAARCATQIEEDGELVRTRTGIIKSHPLLRDEINNRAFCVRCLQRLGLDLEPVGPIGRPPGK